MGSAPSKSSLRKDGLLFIDTSDTSDISGDEEEIEQVTDIHVTDVTTTSFAVNWSPPRRERIEKYQLRIFPPDGLRCKTWVSSCLETTYTFDRLKAGKSYTVGIVAVNDTGNKSMCATKTESTRPVPPTMMVFPAKAITATAIVVCWKPSKGSRDYYEISIEPEDGVSGPTNATNIHGTEHTFTGLVPGVEYHITVVSVSNKMTSPELTGSVITRPGTVLDVAFMEVTRSGISVRWKPPPGVVDSYSLSLVDPLGTCDPITISKIRDMSYSFNGLRAGRMYHLSITSHVFSKDSFPKEFEQCTIPNEVNNLTCQDISKTSAVIKWYQASGDSDSYDLFLTPREGVKGDTCPSGIIGTSYEFTGLLPGTTYTVGVVTNSKDKSSKRVVTTFLTEPSPCGEIQFPKILTTSVEAIWESAKGHVDSYILEIKNTNDSTKKQTIPDIKSSGFIVDDLEAGASYLFNVVTVASGRESTPVSASCCTYPLPVAALEIIPEKSTSRTVTFKWDSPDGIVEKFKLHTTSEGYLSDHEVLNDCHEFELLDLLPATEYRTYISCCSNQLNSKSLCTTFTTGPDKVSQLTLQVLNKNELRVVWDAPNTMVDSYDLSCMPKDGADCDMEPKGVQATEYVFKRLVPGTIYTVSVMPTSQGITGAETKSNALTLPGDILNVHFPGDHLSFDSMKMVWGIEGNTSDVILTITGGGKSKDDVVTSEKTLQYTLKNVTEYKFDNLEPDTNYSVSIQAVNNEYETKGSLTTVTQSTLAKPEIPTIVEPELEVKNDGKTTKSDTSSLSSSSASSVISDEEFLE